MTLFTDHPDDSIASLGERRLITRITRWLGAANPRGPGGIGDDCAVLPRPRGRLLVTVDPVIHGEHFDDSMTAAAAGAKLVKRNLSDIAAMGGTPRSAVLALAMDRSVRTAWLRAFYRSIATVARAHGVRIVGGDIAHHRGGFVASLTLFGETAAGGRALTRSGARRGDWIYVTGRLGGSLPTGRHWKFTPRLAEGRWLVGRREVRSMIDLSDGLGKDVHALTPDGCTPALDAATLPRHRGCDLRAALCDGEDYELAFAVAAKADLAAFEAGWRRAFPRVRLTRIGRFVSKNQRPDDALRLEDHDGFEHLR
ncbi:MAG: thiamine-phosphate kinase [Verrucomicrobiota bacterium]